MSDAPAAALFCVNPPSVPFAESGYVPLSHRTTDELLAHADKLRRMAATATTGDVQQALLTLAERYVALAARRQATKGRHCC